MCVCVCGCVCVRVCVCGVCVCVRDDFVRGIVSGIQTPRNTSTRVFPPSCGTPTTKEEENLSIIFTLGERTKTHFLSLDDAGARP